uniref:protein adenylyltransferase n=1 Tax=Steinernema glaseri TaxID=37863 RepID=A0A1I7Y877_9BILA
MTAMNESSSQISSGNQWLKTVLVSLLVSLSVHFLCANVTLNLSEVFCTYQLPTTAKRLLSCSSSTSPSRSPARKQNVFVVEDPLRAHQWYLEDHADTSTDKRNTGEALPQSISYVPEAKKWTDSEAIAALQAAARSRKHGDHKKAQVIIEHAFNLAPEHPDVLTEYGIFIETVRHDVVLAENMYRRALGYNPYHSEALVRRARTLPLVEEIDNKMLREIRRKHKYFLQIPRKNPALRRAMQESYFQYVYHTVALEGNTMSLVETRSVLETRMVVNGKSVIEHNEILGMDAALRFLNRSLVHVGKLTLDDVLSIHRRVLGYVDPIAAGQLRTTQVFVGSFTPTGPENVEADMFQMIEWLNDEETLQLEPVELAALAHYKLVYIHPFVDGNGRTARLLMNLILMQAGFPPVIVPVEERLTYYKCLQEANQGDLRPFIRFIAKLTDSTLQSYINSASTCEAVECSRSIATPTIST